MAKGQRHPHLDMVRGNGKRGRGPKKSERRRPGGRHRGFSKRNGSVCPLCNKHIRYSGVCDSCKEGAGARLLKPNRSHGVVVTELEPMIPIREQVMDTHVETDVMTPTPTPPPQMGNDNPFWKHQRQAQLRAALRRGR